MHFHSSRLIVFSNTFPFHFSNKNKKGVNQKRAALLHAITKVDHTSENLVYGKDQINRIDCQMAINGLVPRLLNGTYSYKEVERCIDCNYVIHNGLMVPTLSVHDSLLPDYSNLVEAARANFPEKMCAVCQKTLVIERHFGQFLYFEVFSQKLTKITKLTLMINRSAL